MIGSRVHDCFITLALIGGNLAAGYLIQTEPPDWRRWLLLAVAQGALGLVSPRLTVAHGEAVRRLGLKTVLWPAAAAALAGAARLAGIEVYPRIEALAVLSLATAHVTGEWIAWSWSGQRSARRTSYDARQAPFPGATSRVGLWLLDFRWLLAIAGVAWSWEFFSHRQFAMLMASGGAFLWVARPSRLRYVCDDR